MKKHKQESAKIIYGVKVPSNEYNRIMRNYLQGKPQDERDTIPQKPPDLPEKSQ